MTDDVTEAVRGGRRFRLPYRAVFAAMSPEDVLRRLRDHTSVPGAEARVKVHTRGIVARRWVNGYFATGHSVFRGRVRGRTGGGAALVGTVAPSGLDIAIVVILGLAGVAPLIWAGASGSWIACLVAAVPLTLCTLYVIRIPRSLIEGRAAIDRTVRDALDLPAADRAIGPGF